MHICAGPSAGEDNNESQRVYEAFTMVLQGCVDPCLHSLYSETESVFAFSLRA